MSKRKVCEHQWVPVVTVDADRVMNRDPEWFVVEPFEMCELCGKRRPESGPR